MLRRLTPYICSWLLVTASSGAAGGEVLVAVATNFETTLAVLADDFAARTGHAVTRSPGSSGKLYAQIVNGAPYEVLLSADTLRPDRLVADGYAVAGTEYDYAAGYLVLWSARAGYGDCLQRLRAGNFDRLAIANPALAPYGAATREWLVRENLWDAVQPRLVTGQNIGQAFHFVATRNAGLGIAAAAQFDDSMRTATTCYEPVPGDAHEPIRQRAVLLRAGAANPVASEFLAYLGSAPARRLIAARGYR